MNTILGCTICDICMALGGIGTFCKFIFMIKESRRKAKQIDTIQHIQSQQLEHLYEPDIRIASWTHCINNIASKEIVIENCGENLLITDIKEQTNCEVLNKNGMKNWFPRNFDKGEKLHIPLSVELSKLQEQHNIVIETNNRLNLKYESIISINNGKPSASIEYHKIK